MVEVVLVQVNLSKELLSIETIIVHVVKHEAKQVPAERSEVSRQRDSLTFYHIQISLHAHALIARPPCQHLVEDNSQCPDITLLRVVIFFICLRRHVFR